jgi:hypothetical protein
MVSLQPVVYRQHNSAAYPLALTTQPPKGYLATACPTSHLSAQNRLHELPQILLAVNESTVYEMQKNLAQVWYRWVAGQGKKSQRVNMLVIHLVIMYPLLLNTRCTPLSTRCSCSSFSVNSLLHFQHHPCQPPGDRSVPALLILMFSLVSPEITPSSLRAGLPTRLVPSTVVSCAPSMPTSSRWRRQRPSSCPQATHTDRSQGAS